MINVGIREQLMIGVAAGLAQEGLRPVVHSYTPFLVERPFEQIKLDLGHQDVGAILVSIGASYDASEEGRTHQAPGDVALLATLPGFAIHVPGHPDEAEQLLRREFARDGRAYLRLSGEANAEAQPIEQLDGGALRARRQPARARRGADARRGAGGDCRPLRDRGLQRDGRAVPRRGECARSPWARTSRSSSRTSPARPRRRSRPR